MQSFAHDMDWHATGMDGHGLNAEVQVQREPSRMRQGGGQGRLSGRHGWVRSGLLDAWSK